MRELSGRRVLVTGASSGIGLATARGLAAAGAELALCARTMAVLEAEAGDIIAGGGRAHAIACDLESRQSVDRAVSAAVSAMGGIDAVVLAAGVASFSALAEMPDDVFEQQLTVNLRGPFWLLRSAIPHLGEGSDIVFVLSVAVHKGFPGCTSYGASKAALHGLGLALREELRPRGVRVALVTPGATDTPLWESLGLEFDRQRMLAADDVSHAVVAVLSQSGRSTIEELVLRPVGGDL